MHQEDLWGQRSFPVSLTCMFKRDPIDWELGGTVYTRVEWSKGDQTRGWTSTPIDEPCSDLVPKLFYAAWHGYTRTNPEHAIKYEVAKARREWDALWTPELPMA